MQLSSYLRERQHREGRRSLLCPRIRVRESRAAPTISIPGTEKDGDISAVRALDELRCSRKRDRDPHLAPSPSVSSFWPLTFGGQRSLAEDFLLVAEVSCTQLQWRWCRLPAFLEFENTANTPYIATYLRTCVGHCGLSLTGQSLLTSRTDNEL